MQCFKEIREREKKKDEELLFGPLKEKADQMIEEIKRKP